jgi:dinuclear metal center YbgI/SA1388 family protein
MQREYLIRHLDELLDAARFTDYCPNGLQVEGRATVARVVAGVTANQTLIDAAIAKNADVLLVHHGWFWRGEDARVAGIRRSRLKSLLENDINLVAYHLPLDAHAELGNNVQLARRLGWLVERRFGEQDVACVGRLPQATTLAELGCRIAAALAREPLLIGDAARSVTRIAWATGAAQGLFEQAIATGAEVFVSGEISEQTVHLARESGVAYLAAGHHATERYGVQALAEHLAARLGLACEFIDVDSPV